MNYKQDVDIFLNKKSERQKIIVIYGPTGSGKTKMSIDIAKYLNTEIISTDSRQIFKYMDIGTGKITEDEKRGIKHHMLDIINPNEKYSVGLFKRQSEKIINNLHGEGKIPMLVGGTGLYIDSLIFDFNIPQVPSNLELRFLLEKEAKEKGNLYVYNKLLKLDPDYALELHPNNLRYVIRAIEVISMTGKSKGKFKKDKKLKYDVLFLTPNYGDRKNLYNRINKRVKFMVQAGLLDEIKKLLDMGYTKSDFGIKSIGYMEMIPYIEGKATLEDSIKQIQQNSRNYAKRQLTWFRKYSKFI